MQVREARGNAGQRGMAYVAILFLLVIMTTLGLAFLLKAGTETSVTMTRAANIQAEYLAESAVNHALWRLLNEPGFPTNESVYYMHSLAGGRYGYKVRAPGATTFATVATVGTMGDNVVQQSYVPYVIPSNILTAYGQDSSTIPLYRRMIGATWSSPANSANVGSEPVGWTVLKGCPVRKEVVMGTLDDDHDLNLAVWNGAAWGNQTEFSQDAAQTRCFDIAYESQSGDALVVGRRDWTSTLYFNVWDGDAWVHSTPQSAFGIDGPIGAVTMASSPDSDEILIAAVSISRFVHVARWNGSGFTYLGQIETSMDTNEHGFAAIVYEQQSGDALIMWPARALMNYRIWNGTALGAASTVPGFSHNVYVVRAAPDPASDHMVLAGLDIFLQLQVAVWDGGAWSDTRQVATFVCDSTVQCFDVAWEAAGEDAVVAWGRLGSNKVRAMSWRKGTLLADRPTFEGPSFLALPRLVRLFPAAGSERIILLCGNVADRLRYSLWTGDGFKGDPGILLESSLSASDDMGFDIAEAFDP
jgi:hypothetical protein